MFLSDILFEILSSNVTSITLELPRTLVSRVFEAAQAEERALSDDSNQKDSHVNFNMSGHRARTKGFGKDKYMQNFSKD